jgi:hypothetical protein
MHEVHAAVSLEMANDRLDGGAPLELAFNPGRDAALLTCGKDPERIIRRRVVAAIASIGDDAIESIADERLHTGMTVATVCPSCGPGNAATWAMI